MFWNGFWLDGGIGGEDAEAGMALHVAKARAASACITRSGGMQASIVSQ
jgi:hypothetical protein